MAACSGGEVGIGLIACNIVGSIGGVALLIEAIAYVAAFGLAIDGAMKLRHNGVGNQPSWPGGLLKICIAVMLIALPSVMGGGIVTLFDSGAQIIKPSSTWGM